MEVSFREIIGVFIFSHSVGWGDLGELCFGEGLRLAAPSLRASWAPKLTEVRRL